jgi:hypothetical protein
MLPCAKQQFGQCHTEHFVGDAVNAAQWLEQRGAHGLKTIWRERAVGHLELSINPGHEITVGNVADE